MRQAFQHEKPGQDVDEKFLSLVSARAKVSSGWWMQFGMPTEGRQTMKGTPWVVVEADDKQTIQKEFGKGEILDQFPEIDALVGQEIENDPLAAKEVLHVHQVHL